MARQPAVSWAQREQLILLKFEVDDIKLEDLSVSDGNKLHFAGSSHNEKYECTIDLFEEVDISTIKKANNRVFEISIEKKEANWWPRLLKEKGKAHWLRVDFDKWIDEDEEGADEPAPPGMGNFDLQDYMQQMGGGMGGMPGMPGMGGLGGMGMGGMPDFDGLDDLKDDEEGDLPDLESDVKEPK